MARKHKAESEAVDESVVNGTNRILVEGKPEAREARRSVVIPDPELPPVREAKPEVTKEEKAEPPAKRDTEVPSSHLLGEVKSGAQARMLSRLKVKAYTDTDVRFLLNFYNANK